MTAAPEAPPLPCGPAADGHDRPYWDGLVDCVLRLPRCAECGAWRPLGRVMCAACWSLDASWDDVAPRGRVFTWIRTHRDFMDDLDVAAPYATVLVALDDVPVRLLGLLLDNPTVAIGDRVSGVVQQPANAAWPLLRWEIAS